MTPSTTARRCSALPCSNTKRSTPRTSVIHRFRDCAVHLGTPVTLEVEDRRAVFHAGVEIALGDHDLVARRLCPGDDLAGWSDDLTFRQRVDPFFETAFGDAHDPCAVLICAGRHHEVVVESGQAILR